MKDAADIVDRRPAGGAAPLGQRYQGLCPFHDERTPSFSVNATEKVYHCFGCGVGGDVITFVEEKEGLVFGDAVEAPLTATAWSWSARRRTRAPRRRASGARPGGAVRSDRGVLRDVPMGLGGGRQGARVPARQGLREEALREFGGLRAEQVGQVYLRGQQAGFTVAEMVAAGLVKKGTKGGHLDHFRAHHVPHPRRARADAGVRRTGDARGGSGRST